MRTNGHVDTKRISHAPGATLHRTSISTRTPQAPYAPYAPARDADCDVVINDSSVSRHHAMILVSGRQAVIRDLDSKNGTRVGGARITGETMLESGEVVTFGSIDAEFVVEVPSNASTQTIDVSRK